MGPVFKQHIVVIACYNASKFYSSTVIISPPPLNIIVLGVKDILYFGNNNMPTCYTANFLSAPSFSDIIVINI
jgi:hypothetical protein